METIIYNKYSNERIPKFNIRTEIVSDDGVKKICKYATDVAGIEHIKNMYKSYVIFNELYGTDGLQICPCVEEEQRVVFTYIDGNNLKDILLEAVAQDDMELFDTIFDRYVGYLKKYSKEEAFQPCDLFLEMFGNQLPSYKDQISVFKPTNIDMVFDNIIEKDGVWYVIDYEWTFDITVPMEFVLFRTLFYLMYNSPYQLKFEEMDLYNRVGIEKEKIPIYEAMEAQFQAYVVGDIHAVKEYYQPGIDVKDIFVKRLWERDELVFYIYEDTGNGFCEEQKKKYVEKLDENGAFSFSYTIPDDVIRFRVDPGEDPILFEVKEIIEGVVETNATQIVNNKYYFLKEDPWIIIEKEKMTDRNLYLNGNASKMSREIGTELNDAYKRIEGMQNSVSWKIKAGLKWMKRFFFKASTSKRTIKKDVPEIAIHVHLFYVDLLEEFVSYFKNIPYPFCLYISCVKGADKKGIEEYAKNELENAQNVVVKILPNRGRDIAPFYVGFNEEIQQHKYVLHIHSKKSKHIETGGGDWRVYSLNSLIGSKDLVKDIMSSFEHDSSLGLVYPEVHPDIPMIGFTWMANGTGGQALLNEMNIPYESGLFSYPTGSFFWARVDAIRPIFQKGLRYKDFPGEKGQIDGTFAHVLERAIAFVNKAGGYHSYIVDIEEDAFRYDKSIKPFRDYMKTDVEMLKKELMQYDSISFGVFDTLLASDYLNEDYLFKAVQQKFGLDEQYVLYRKDAERIARETYGASMSIHEIYSELARISPVGEDGVQQLKSAEIELFGQRLYPRYEMREVYRYLLEQGKKVSIVCDSYYTASMIEAMLVRGGYLGFEKLFVSCDYGYSKRDEHMWNIVYHEYDMNKHIHVGADVYADWYTLERRGAKSHWIMSGMEAYKLSKYYKEINDNISLDEAVEWGRKINKEWFNSPLDLIHNEGMQ